MLYVLLCGYPPFNGENDDEILENVLTKSLEFPTVDWAWVSKDALDLIR